MILSIYEVLEKAATIEDKEAKITYLRQNTSQALLVVLQLVFNQTEFSITSIPEGYKPNDSPVGMGYTNLHKEWRQLTYFIKNSPLTLNMTPKKVETKFLRFVESMEAKEAEVVFCMIRKDLKAYGLRKSIVREAFPELGL